MFPGGQPDMQEMLRQAQRLQEQVFAAQEELARTQVQGSAGGGLVSATVTGTGELVGLTIEREAVDPDDPETLADLVLAAVRDATGRAADLQANAMGPLGQGLGGLGDLAGPQAGPQGLAGGGAVGPAGSAGSSGPILPGL